MSKNRVKVIFTFAKPHIVLFLVLFLCVVLTTFSGAIYPYIFGRLVDEVFYAKQMKMFLQIIIIYAIVYFINQVLHFILNMTWAKLMTKFLFDIKKMIFTYVLAYKSNIFSDIYTGDIISIINKDTEAFLNFIHRNVFYIIDDSLNLIVSIMFLVYISWPIAIVSVLLTPISVYISRGFAKRIKNYYQKIRENEGVLSSWLFEIIKGMQDIKLLCAAKNVMGSYTKRTIKVSKLKIEANRIEVLSDRVNSGVSLFAQLLLYFISTILIFNDQLTIGGFVACISYFSRCISVFNNLNGNIYNITNNMVSIDRVLNLLNIEVENYNEDCKRIEIKSGKISFNNVSFSYYKNISVLKNITFDINAGERISIVGHSGVGKTTLSSLIYKLYETQSGLIKIDDININECNLHSLREQIGVVYQDIILFDETIRYNLSFSENDNNDNMIWDALEKAHLSDFVKSLSNGLDTKIGVGGHVLSGGQKQRLAIARIFIKDPKILIFDEATSSLDIEAEQVIKNSWENIYKGRTIIIIAHRLSTIINSDRVLVMKNGEIVGYDKHENLLNTCDTYINLFKEQYFLNEATVNV